MGRQSELYVIRRAIIVVVASATLTACGQERPAIQKPPIDLLTCAPEPDAPDLPGRDEQARRDVMTLDYILALRSAWGDCAANIAGVKAWADGLNN